MYTSNFLWYSRNEQVTAYRSRLEYPPLPRYALWIMTEVAIIGSDIQEVPILVFDAIPTIGNPFLLYVHISQEILGSKTQTSS